MQQLNTNTRYLHPEIIRLAEKLTSKLPDHLDTCYFVCSGSEANELAIRIAKAYTKRNSFIVLEGAYHGNTSTLIDLSPYKNKGPGGQQSPDWVHEVPLPYASSQQKLQGHKHLSKAKESINAVEALCKASVCHHTIAGLIAESFPSCAGQIECPPGFLGTVYQLIREAGGLCIADEVQTGFGRIGSHYWGFEASGVLPDIVTLGKPMGNGHPIAAVVTSREIAESFNNGMEYFNSFGGNPVSCAIANAVMEVIDREKLQEQAFKKGACIKNAFNHLASQASFIEEVRGQGLFLGIELKNQINGIDLRPHHHDLIQKMKSRGFLLSLDGLERNVIKINRSFHKVAPY